MSPALLAITWQTLAGHGKKEVARLLRRVLPPATLTLRHVEPGLTLRVNVRRHVMFWSGGLNRFEPYTVRALRAAVEEGDTVLDVGGNIGFFSTLLSRYAGPSGRVLAFEPEPANLGLLRENLARNGCANVTVIPCAAGLEAGTAVFSLDAATGATGRLGVGATAGELAVGTGTVHLIETAVETIDGVADRLEAAPDVIKLDIEGGELQALTGALETLRRHRPIVVSELTGESGGDVVRLLDGLGYLLWDLESGRTVGPGDQPFMVVAIPSERADSPRGRRVRGTVCP